MEQLSDRFATALYGVYWFKHPIMQLEYGEPEIVKQFLKGSPAEKLELIQELEALGVNNRPFDLHQLPYECVVALCENLESVLRAQTDATDSPLQLLALTKYSLLAKAILLVSYHYGLTCAEISALEASRLVVQNEMVRLVPAPRGVCRPLNDLEPLYHKTLSDWSRFKAYEAPHDRLFGAIVPSGDLLSIPLGVPRYQDVARFLLLVRPWRDAGQGTRTVRFPVSNTALKNSLCEA